MPGYALKSRTHYTYPVYTMVVILAQGVKVEAVRSGKKRQGRSFEGSAPGKIDHHGLLDQTVE